MSDIQPAEKPHILITDWRSAHKLWSVQLNAVSALLTGIEFVLPIFMSDPPIARGWFAGFAFLVSISAITARLIIQKRAQ